MFRMNTEKVLVEIGTENDISMRHENGRTMGYPWKLEEDDLKLLRALQNRCDRPLKEVALDMGQTAATVNTRVKKLESMGIIKGYKAVIDPAKVNRGATALVMVSFAYRPPESGRLLSQREAAKEIALLPEVQEVHLITGEWDLAVKIRAKDIETLGKFVVDRLRSVRGVDRTLTCMVLHTEKETLEVNI